MDTLCKFILHIFVFGLHLTDNGIQNEQIRFGLQERVGSDLCQAIIMDGRGRVKWSPQMLIDLLRCKKEGQDEMKQKKQQRGLRNEMFRKWNEMGYEHLNLTAQNLHDRATKAERNSKTLREHTEKQRQQSMGAQNTNFDQERGMETENSESTENSIVPEIDNYANQQQSQATREKSNQPTNTIEPSIEKDNNEGNSTLFDKVRETYNAVCNDEMSFDERLWSTKPRKIPTIKDQEMLNEVTERLISTMNVNSVVCEVSAVG